MHKPLWPRGLVMKIKLFASLASTLLLSSLSLSSANAQGDYRGGNDRNNNASDFVTIYEHCDFRGDSREVLVGDFKNMRSVNFGNDSVSSVRVRNGMELVIYADDDFRGSYARVSQDISCFDRQWNDKVSSLRVASAYNDNRQSNNSRNQDTNNNRDYDGRDYDNRGRDNHSNNNSNANVNAKNVSRVAFDGKVLQQVDTKNWRMNGVRGGVSQYQEIRRDRDSVHLQNTYTAEKIRIDLFANDVTLVKRNGRQQRYNIQGKQASLNAAPAPVARNNNNSNRRINKQCFNYRATSRGGEASVRFQTRESLKRFNNSTVTGRVCHKGSLNMEIGKRDAKTNVVIEIEGQKYRFAPNEQENEYLNSWFRKRVQLNIGR